MVIGDGDGDGDGDGGVLAHRCLISIISILVVTTVVSQYIFVYTGSVFLYCSIE